MNSLEFAIIDKFDYLQMLRKKSIYCIRSTKQRKCKGSKKVTRKQTIYLEIHRM